MAETNNKNNNIVASILHNLDLKMKQVPNILFKSNSSSNVDFVKEETTTTTRTTKAADVVKFSEVKPNIPPPLELEADLPTGRTSNPLVLWQVYAITGFMVLRWVVARWNERKERKTNKDSSDDDQTQTNDDNAPSQ
ncbi:hypothetical protein ACFE04_010704 [Oxalis oulophora]